MDISLRNGVIGGLLTIVYLLVLYFVDKTMLVEGWEKITWLLLLGVLLWTAIGRRSQEPDAFISFKPLLQTVFKTFIIAYLLKFAFVYVLFRYIDTELMQMAKLVEMELIMQFRDPDVPQVIFEQQIEGYKNGDFGPRIFDIGMMFELILGFVLSVVTAGIIRRDTPNY